VIFGDTVPSPPSIAPGDYTVKRSDWYVEVTATADVLVTLPPARTVRPGHAVTVKDGTGSDRDGDHAIHVVVSDLAAIDGDDAVILRSAWAVVSVVSNGAAWRVLGARL
jgi:hypothetical protein